jgi:hypothetical protein
MSHSLYVAVDDVLAATIGSFTKVPYMDSLAYIKDVALYLALAA